MRHSLLCVLLACATSAAFAEPADRLHITWKDNYLTVTGGRLADKQLKVLYLEAYCRAGSTKREWKQTVIGHKTTLISSDDAKGTIRLQCLLKDGVTVDHQLTAGPDDVDFQLNFHNPTDKPSELDWGQPCLRVDDFCGRDKDNYLPKCFIFQGGKLTRMPTPNWATDALYTPGQVWAARGVNRDDVNPRPLNPNTPDNSLIGCFSADEKTIVAIAFEPNHELFQGIYACLHSDFHVGGLKPGERKTVRGKLYVMPAEPEALLARWAKDFPAQSSPEPSRP